MASTVVAFGFKLQKQLREIKFYHFLCVFCSFLLIIKHINHADKGIIIFFTSPPFIDLIALKHPG